MMGHGGNKVPDYLLSTYRMVKCAFPDGIKDEEYLPLLAILLENMSIRVLAELMTYLVEKDYGDTLHDVYCAGADPITQEILAGIRHKLHPCGYEVWQEEEG